MSGYLIHYASPYYDPVKAHEYYEEHKQLKGRRSTAGLNDAGKAAARYVKQQINEERDKKIERRKDEYSSNVDSHKTNRDQFVLNEKAGKEHDLNQHKEEMTKGIDQIKSKIKNLTSDERKGPEGEKLRAEIAKLREKNSEKRAEIMQNYKSSVSKHNDRYKSKVDEERTSKNDDIRKYRDEANSAYEKELDNLSSDSEFKKVSKRKTKKK